MASTRHQAFTHAPVVWALSARGSCGGVGPGVMLIQPPFGAQLTDFPARSKVIVEKTECTRSACQRCIRQSEAARALAPEPAPPPPPVSLTHTHAHTHT